MKKILAIGKTRKLIKVFEIAKELEKKLSWIPNCSNGMDRIVEFFEITSSTQDNVLKILGGVNFKKEKNREFIENFKKFLENTGRCEYGWNRTKVGEIPNSSSVFINMKVPYDEMFNTRSVYEHLSRRNNPKGEVDYAVKESAYGKWNETGLIENEIVNPFMKENYQFLQKNLRKFN